MIKNPQKGNIYLVLTIMVVTFLTVGTVIYLNFPEEEEKFRVIFPPRQSERQEIHLSEVLRSLTSPLSREISESEKKELEKILKNLSSKDVKKTPPQVQKEILDSLTPQI